ncbi:MAG: PAS domain-containing protein [Anaerolineales bacterium]|nr:PAS domain-containing protein [Anaerolineales bacterium]
MFTLTNNLIVILIITSLINSFTIYISWKRRKNKGGLYITLAMLGIAIWTLFAEVNYATVPIPLKVFFAKWEYTFYNITFAFLAMFSLVYGGFADWLKKKSVKAFFWVIPISNILLAWTNDWHGLLWKSFTGSDFGNNTLIFGHGPGYYWAGITGLLMTLIIILPIWKASRIGTEFSRRQARLLFITSMLSVVSAVIYLLASQRLKGVDWAPIICCVLGILYILILYGTRLLDLVPIARYTMIEQMSDCVLVLDENNRMVDFNPAAQELFQINHDHLGKPLQTVMVDHPEIVDLFSHNSNRSSPLTVVHEGEPRMFDTHLALFKDNFGKQYGKLMTLSDVTKHHQTEQALAQRLFEIRELNKNLQESQAQIVAQQRRLAKLEERKRLGRDMHDSVNQSIHSLMLFSETLASLLKKGQVAKALSVAERIEESGRRALKEIRMLVFESQSQESDEITDLLAALRDRFSFVENRAGVQTEIILDGTLPYIPSEWNENLFWITIEALNNALKYAQTNKVKIFFRYKDKRLEMEIVDKGVGFDPDHRNGGGMGMRTMRERAELLDGKLFVTSSPGCGTSVLFSAEIKEQNE